MPAALLYISVAVNKELEFKYIGTFVIEQQAIAPLVALDPIPNGPNIWLLLTTSNTESKSNVKVTSESPKLSTVALKTAWTV